ncbi:MAG: sigma 54-interacting transcriptional regulator [Pseudomonadota bacterium]
MNQPPLEINEELDTIFNTAMGGFWLVDATGTIVYANKAGLNFVNLEKHQVVGKKGVDLIKAGYLDRCVSTEVIKSKHPITCLQHSAKNKKYLLVKCHPVFNSQGNIIYVFCHEKEITLSDHLWDQVDQNLEVLGYSEDSLFQENETQCGNVRIVVQSVAMRQILRNALKLARLSISNILILGESGTGKGLIARFIHEAGPRKGHPLIEINCAALPKDLVEAELFGYEKGAFTGAREKGKVGLFELARNGTILLDEIGDLSLSAQAKLLKCLEDRKVMRLGGTHYININCAFIAATNQDLDTLVKQKHFRADLFYRLNGFCLKISPLRERPEDIPELIKRMLEDHNRQFDHKKSISPWVIKVFQSLPLHGNVRELNNLVMNAAVMSDKDVLDEYVVRELGVLEPTSEPESTDRSSMVPLFDQLGRTELHILKDALIQCKSTREIARSLGMSQSTVVRKLRKHGLKTTVNQK